MNLYDISTIKSVLQKHGFTFSKALGQNFLVDPDVCPEMVRNTCCTEQTLAIEVGPGIGVLTKELCKNAGKVIAIELDKRLIPVLEETLADFDNLEVINDDVMKLDMKKLIMENSAQYTDVVVCANLPYYITSPIVMNLLENELDVRCITVMVQKEAAKRLCAEIGSRESGAVSVAVNYYAKSNFLFEVERDCFVPSPNVDSAVIRLDLRKEPPIAVKSKEKFFLLVKGAFAQRRKTAVNSISGSIGLEKDKICVALSSLEIDSAIRGEKLTMNQLGKLSDLLW